MRGPLRMLMDEDELLKPVVAPFKPCCDATTGSMKMVQQCVSSPGLISPSYLSAVFALLLTAVGVGVANEPRVELSGFRGNGGRVAWSPTGEFVIFDRKGSGGGIDLYLTEDFETERCLTCNHPDLPNPKRNYGQPAIHPNGRYVVFQAEKQEHPFIIPLATNPGAGVFNDLWLYDLETGRATVLWEVPNAKNHGVLHPQFSKDGRQLSWSELVGAADFKVPGKGAGVWVLKTADFSPGGLTNVKQHQPGEDVIYENHGFSHDGEWLYFSSNMKRSRAVNEATDIHKLHLGTGELVRLTDEGYNEHAHLSPDGKYIVWMSSVGLGDTYDYYRVGTEYWLMNVDGSNKRRLTHLNDPEHPHFRGRYAIAADFDFSPTSSEETGYRLLAYLHELVTKNFGIPSKDLGAKGEYNFFVDFTLGSAAKPPTPPNPMIHAVGSRLVDGNGDPIQLRGVLLEGWLMWNGALWGAGLSSETKLSGRIEGLVGREEAARFRKAVYDTFITERDIEMIADLGFNVVRVPFNHTVLEKNGAVDDSAPGWFYLDRLLNWCEKHQVYVVLDLHSVPNGQSGVFVADPDAKHVWTSEEALQRSVDIWKAIAARYRDRSIVAGYDLINEPEPPKDHELIDLYRRIIEAIRVVDTHHLVFLTGKALSTDFRFFDGPLDDNQAYTFHTYNFFSHDIDEANLAKIASIAREHDVPLWNGEFGAHTDRWTSSQIELFENPSNHVNGWIYWPWKRVPETGWQRERFAHLMEIESTQAWDTVRKHLGSIFGWKKIPKELARRGLAEFIEASKAENLVADERMVTALQGWQRSSGSGPPPKPSTETSDVRVH